MALSHPISSWLAITAKTLFSDVVNTRMTADNKVTAAKTSEKNNILSVVLSLLPPTVSDDGKYAYTN